MVLDTYSLNTQQYKVRIKGKVEQSWEKSSALLLRLGVVAIGKGAFWSPSTTVTNFTLLLTGHHGTAVILIVFTSCQYVILKQFKPFYANDTNGHIVWNPKFSLVTQLWTRPRLFPESKTKCQYYSFTVEFKVAL